MESSIMGTYVLALWLEARRSISVGQQGRFEFPAGWYLYVGSARGPGGLQARLARHRRRLGAGKRAHWHVDYLREEGVWGGAWGRASDGRGCASGEAACTCGEAACTCGEAGECAWAAALCDLPGARVVVPGFGASDCGCPAHLVHVASLPTSDWFAATLGAERILTGKEELGELVGRLTWGDDPGREAAAVAVGQVGEAAMEPLAALLEAEDADSRWWAARALAEVGGEAAAAALAGALNDPDPDVRACAALALGRVGAGSACRALAGRLGDESAFVASIAADALSMIGEPAVETLTGMLEAESSQVRLLAVRALGRIKDPSAIEPLLGLLEDPSYLVRYYAHETLEALGVGMVFLAP